MSYLVKPLKFLSMLAVLGMLSACQTTSAAEAHPAIPSYAISQKAKTALGDVMRADVESHGGKSGFRVLKTGSSAYEMRLGLIRAAERTLDLQYYSMHDDLTGNLLLEAVLRAAERGVRIRMLIDGVNIDELEETLSVLDEFKNIEVRVFNPFATRDDGVAGPVINALTDLDGLNRRMHNKALIADNQMAIMGGRNLGDEYFEEHTDVTFRDLDVLAAGPIVAQLSKSFDDYWNSEPSVPIAQVERPKRDIKLARKLRTELKANWDKTLTTPKGKRLLGSPLAGRVKEADVTLMWAHAEVTVDRPHKIQMDAEETNSAPLRKLNALLNGAKREFIAVSPYLVPQEEGVEWLTGFVDRGVDVRILTNSLDSTDVVAVHSGYRRYRDDLVNGGVELYELKPIDGKKANQRLLGKSSPAHASLHAKAYVIDRDEVMIGSFNLDPRSIALNTEIALVIHSREVARDVIAMFNEAISPKTSYRVVPDGKGGIKWVAEIDGQMMETKSEPAGFWRSIQTNMMSALPIEKHL